MTVGTRRFIYLSFIIIFLVVAPILIFYANGFRYNFKLGKIQKTGIIFLTSGQTDATVYLNNQLYPAKLNGNLSLNDLLPDDYLVRIEKEGFYPWQKKLTVREAQTTFTDNVILFKKELPINLIPGQISWLSSSPDQQKIVYLIDKNSAKELWLYEPATDQSVRLYQLPSPASTKLNSISWSASNKKILVSFGPSTSQKSYVVLNIERPQEITNLADLTQLNFDQIKWDNQSDLLLGGLANQQLYQIDLAIKKITSLLKIEIGSNELIGDFLIKDEVAYYLKTGKTSSFLSKINFGVDPATTSQIKLPRSPTYQLITGSNDFLTLLDQSKKALWLINLANFENLALADQGESLIPRFEAKNAQWTDSGRQLLFYNDFEIWTDQPASGKSQLIDRSSEEVKEVIWQPGNQYLIALIGDRLRILELADRDRNVIDLIKLDKIEDLNTDSSGSKLFFIGQLGKQIGLYELTLE